MECCGRDQGHELEEFLLWEGCFPYMENKLLFSLWKKLYYVCIVEPKQDELHSPYPTLMVVGYERFVNMGMSMHAYDGCTWAWAYGHEGKWLHGLD